MMHLYKGTIMLLMGILLMENVFAQDKKIWEIQADNIRKDGYYGETVANGVVGVISSPERLKAKDVVMNGTFDRYGRGNVSNILRVFNVAGLGLSIDGRDVAADDAPVQHYNQCLDMKNASFRSVFDYGDKATVSYTYYALRQLPFNIMVDVTIQAKKDIRLSPSTVIAAPDILQQVKGGLHSIGKKDDSIYLLTTTAKSPTGALDVAASNAFLFDGTDGKEFIPVYFSDSVQGISGMSFTKSLKKGQSLHFAIVSTVLTTAQVSDPANEVERMTAYARLQGYDKLVSGHRKAWDALWQSDIHIDGSDSIQRDVHSMLYHLYSFTRKGSSYGMSPMGLSGLGYNGHSFWDTEIWMYPALLALHPELAKSLLDYRADRLKQAKFNAYLHGYEGAMYPWESAATGFEETPVFALTGPFEHHISADIAIAAWNYFRVTHDTAWLAEKGWPLIRETADFWCSRVTPDGKGRYDINNVVCADEWAENVDNNAYTNAAAKYNLQIARQCAGILGKDANEKWSVIAAGIPILRMANGVTQEYAGYNGQKIKQADVNLLAFPLQTITDKRQIEQDLHYYEDRVGDGPAMTHAIFSILYSQLLQPANALKAFTDGYRPNILPPFGVIAETAGGNNPYFVTGAGGMIQAMMFGFGGLRITDNGIIQIPTKLPTGWKSLKITGVGMEKKTFYVKEAK